MPTSTDLVTDLPADFETFGQAVDTSLAELKGGTTGQVLSKTSNTDMDFTWITSDDTNAIQNTIVDAKGDLIAASGSDVPARLAVGANDLILTAASGETTGLKYSGGYSSWTPTWTGLTVGNGTQTARFTQLGKTVRFDLELIFGSTTAITAAYPDFTFPVAAVKPTAAINAVYIDANVNSYFNTYYIRTVSGGYLIAGNVAGTYMTEAGVSATVPFTWTTGDRFIISGSYEVG